MKDFVSESQTATMVGSPFVMSSGSANPTAVEDERFSELSALCWDLILRSTNSDSIFKMVKFTIKNLLQLVIKTKEVDTGRNSDNAPIDTRNPVKVWTEG
jgi:hypothetical protein